MALKDALEKLGFSSKDNYSLPDSSLRFPDGAHCRIEIAGVENVNALEGLIDEMQKRNVPVHRIISAVGGSTLLTKDELKSFARLARDAKLEVVINPCSSRGWDTGRQLATPEGYVSGYRIRGNDKLTELMRDIDRCLQAGIRGFLVVDEGLLMALGQMRKNGDLPEDVVLKLSVFAGHGNPCGARLAQELGASTFNPLADLTLPMLSSIRAAVSIPMDVYVYIVDAMGGFNRFQEAAEIARVAAPVYFKIEPGESEAALYKPWVQDFHGFWCREKVKHAQIIKELIKEQNPDIKISEHGVSDLVIPVV